MTLSQKFGLIILAFFFCGKFNYTYSQDLKFKRHTIEDGLSQSTINCTLQDQQGFIWFGTQDGLNCWDGYKFTVYRNDASDSTSLSHSYVRSIYQDSQGRLWIGTMSGFNLFIPKLKRFERYHCVPKNLIREQQFFNNSVRAITENNLGQLVIGTYGAGLLFFNAKTKKFEKSLNKNDNPMTLSNNRVCSMLADRGGRIWIGTEGGGIDILDFKNEKVAHYKNDPKNTSSLSSNRVYSIHQDHSGRMWIGTYNGLNLLTPKTKSFERFEHHLDDPFSLSNNTVNSVFEDYKGRLWVGTNDGLNLLDPATRTFRIFKNNPGATKSLSDNYVNSIYETKSGQLIVGTYGGGINLVDGRAEQFLTFSNDPSKPTSLSSNSVWSIHKDRKSRLWVGTSKGLNLFNAKSNTFEKFEKAVGLPFLLSHSSIMAIVEDHEGRIWVGTSRNGLIIMDLEKTTFEHYQHIEKQPLSLPSNSINSFYEDKAGRMWVATNIGLSLFDPKTKTFQLFQKDENGLHPPDHNITNFVNEDRTGRLWVGTNGGLSLFNVSTSTFTNYLHDPDDSTTISNNNAYYIHEDRRGRLWIGTDAGLNLFEDATHSFRALHYGKEFPNDVFYSVLEDEKGRLWSSTNKGIVRFTPATDFAPDRGRWGEFKSFTAIDGIQNDEFSLGASFTSSDGTMYFGGVNGFNKFHPDSIQDDMHVPPVVITNLEVFNKPIIPGKDYNGFVLPLSITETDELILSYRESVFTLEFAALAFTNAKKSKYAYQLEGFDEEWNYTDASRRIATYTNLDAGTYTFRVKGSNQDGVWNEKGQTLTIIITPPWWKTWWFRTFLVLATLGIIVLVFIIRTRNIRRANKILTETVAQRTKELTETNTILVEQEREIIAQNEELMTQATVLAENNRKLEKAKSLLEIEIKYLHQTELFKSSIEVQETERKRIAQNLHDELGATLSIARMHIDQILENGNTDNIKANLERTKMLTETALASMRRISHALMPPLLEKYGLVEALQSMANQINSSHKISMDFDGPEEARRWSMAIELGIYRICLEMINNTLKYAEARSIKVELSQDESHIFLTYKDDGKGLPKTYIEGLGFKSIAARTNSLGGTFEIMTEHRGFFGKLIIPYTLD